MNILSVAHPVGLRDNDERSYRTGMEATIDKRRRHRMSASRWLCLVIAALLAVAAPRTLLAQETQGIAAVVNDEVVSRRDLENRINLFVVTANLENQPDVRQRLAPEVLRTLIADALKRQEARRLNIVVKREDVDNAIAQVAAQLKISPAEVPDYLERRGARMATLIEQIETEIAWQKTVSRSAASEAVISEDEIDQELQRQRERPSGPEYRVAEIFLPIENRLDESKVQTLAQRLIEELRHGATFPTLARNFSQGSTASTGGDLGWLRHGDLEPELDHYLDELEPGELIGPVRTPAGFHLMLMIEKRRGGETAGAPVKFDILQVFAPLPAKAPEPEIMAQVNALRGLSNGATSCQDVISRNGTLATPFRTNTSAMESSDMPADLRRIVMPLRAGETAPPVRVANGLLMLMVCQRSEMKEDASARAAIQQRLEQQRFAEVARRLLRELRRSAVIDVRS